MPTFASAFSGTHTFTCVVFPRFLHQCAGRNEGYFYFDTTNRVERNYTSKQNFK